MVHKEQLRSEVTKLLRRASTIPDTSKKLQQKESVNWDTLPTLHTSLSLPAPGLAGDNMRTGLRRGSGEAPKGQTMFHRQENALCEINSSKLQGRGKLPRLTPEPAARPERVSDPKSRRASSEAKWTVEEIQQMSERHGDWAGMEGAERSGNRRDSKMPTCFAVPNGKVHGKLPGMGKGKGSILTDRNAGLAQTSALQAGVKDKNYTEVCMSIVVISQRWQACHQ